MSLARAFTKRTRRPEVAPLPMREGSVRYAPGTINRDKISLPTELISTTNMHALNAPDIRSVSASTSKSSLRESEGSSEFSHIDTSFIDSPMTTPDTSSIESSPTMTSRAQSFFDSKSPKHSASTGAMRSSASVSSNSSADTPALPQRARSHSKLAHQELARKRSASRLSPPPSALPGANVVRDSSVFFNGSLDQEHPFGKELAQVAEVAEEFGIATSVIDEEEELLASKGLLKFSVEDYMNEIEGLCEGPFGPRMANMWI